MDRLLTLEDLAERWGVSKGIALDVVRWRRVPYICLRGNPSSGRKTLRFRLESIEAWELSQQLVDDEVPKGEPMKAVEAKGPDGFTESQRAAMISMGWDGETI